MRPGAADTVDYEHCGKQGASVVLNTMMEVPLTFRPILERAGRLFGPVEIISRLPNKQLLRSTYSDLYRRSRALAGALTAAGLERGDRVATLMWNHQWHLEAYFGIPLSGCVLHTLNVRLHPDELSYIANHAEDHVLIVDDVLLPLYEKFRATTRIKRVIVVPTMPESETGAYEAYDDFLAMCGDYEFPSLEENEAAAMCYTSGTTGRPKGVVYSHRTMMLHALCASLPDNNDLSQADCVLPAVAMFHVNAWGIPYSAVAVGAKLILPGQFLDGNSLLELLESEQVTRSAGVPTVWMGVLELLNREPDKWHLHPQLRVTVGGSAAPKDLMRGLQRHGVDVRHAWGMTETGPLATVSNVKSYLNQLPEERRLDLRAKQGLYLPMIDVRVIGDSGPVACDGKALGELQIRGPWVARNYYNLPEEQNERWTSDGWFRTGDVVTIDKEGYIQIADRTKDLIKSGGEWISSVDLENALMEHPCVREAAVVAVPHPQWQERPVAAIVLKNGAYATSEALRNHLASKFSNWQLPDAFIFLPEIPRTSVGKFQKSKLREMFAAWDWNKAPEQ